MRVTVPLLAACGQTVAPAAQDVAVVDVAVTDDGLADATTDDAAADTVPDFITDAPEDVTSDIAPDVTPDVADVVADVGQCQIDDDCTAQMTLSPCQLPHCAAGVCVPVKNPDACCVDADCDDGSGCTTFKCDQQKHQCTNSPIANCCSGKVLLQDTGFEAGMDGFVSTDGAQNGDVTWQTTSYRAHSGKMSLYFGNACHTYDNSETVAGACKPLIANTTPVSTTLLSKTWQLPDNNKAQAHFWLWLDTEPPYTKTLQPGTCDPPCNASSSCVVIAGAPVCEPEKDVLVLQVLAQDAPPAPVFWSTQIGKTTLGDPQAPSGWRHIVVDLGNWQGKSIQLAWQFDTKTNENNDYEGIYLDDIVVETICKDQAGVSCTDSQPCLDDGVACTADTCTDYSNVPGTGVCFHDVIAACCLGDADCNDGNACTLDSCTAANVCKFTPDASKAGCCQATVLQADNFDKQPLTWAFLDANSTTVFWRANPNGGNGGGGSLYFGNATFTNFDDPTLQPGEGPHHTACDKPIQLDAGTNYKLLKFDLNMDTEWSDVPAAQYVNPPIPGNPKLDWFSVQIATGGNYELAWSSDSIFGTTHGQWQPITVSLDAWAGKSIQVCMRFEAGDGILNDKPGVNIDNYSVSEACQKADCYWDTDCAQKTCAACQQAVCTAAVCTCEAVGSCP